MPRRSRSRSRDRRRSRSRDRDRRSTRRSRSRSRDRRRSRSPRRDRRSAFSDGNLGPSDQQQQLQSQMLQQQLMLQQQAMAGGMGLMSGRKQREVYVGNLTLGVVTDMMLRELFNGALAHLVPNPQTNPPVVNAQLDPTGRFGFVEMRTEELATSAMQLDKVEVCGRAINVGRPRGYVEPPAGAVASNMGAAQMFAASLASQPTRCLLLDNMLKAVQVLDDEERGELLEDAKDESSKYGVIENVCAPKPPPSVSANAGSRVYIMFRDPDGAAKAKAVFHGRQFDGNEISANYVGDDEFARAAAGQWVLSSGPGPSLPPPPGLMQSGPLPPGISGVAALNPTMATMMSGNPMMAGMVGGQLMGNASGAPFQEGWLKLRGIPFNVAKADIIRFFVGCGSIQEDQVKIVLGPDMRPSGEAYVEIIGPDAKLRLALAKDRQVMPNSSRYVEIFTSNKEELERRIMTGTIVL